MKQRCLQEGHKHYGNYGGRGVKICPEWMSYSGFLKDLGERPLNTSLDRIDSNGDYCPENCRWATRTEQNRNNSQNRIITIKDKSLCLSEWCELLNLNYSKTYMRLFRLNWNPYDALFK